MDCRMPDQDGVETAAIIRRAISEPLPIILISAYDSADVETKARHAGVNGFMTKPVFMSTCVGRYRDMFWSSSCR
ncbi:MAG: response regulator [Phascolarctobacterium faecium]